MRLLRDVAAILGIVNNVRVHASVQEDGSVAVMVLNMHVTNIADVKVNITGIDLESEGLLDTLTGGTTLSGAMPAAGLGNSFFASVAPCSISTYITPAFDALILKRDGNNDGTRENETASRGIVGDFDYVAWKENYSATLPPPGSGGITSSVMEPSRISIMLVCLGLFLRIGWRRPTDRCESRSRFGIWLRSLPANNPSCGLAAAQQN